MRYIHVILLFSLSVKLCMLSVRVRVFTVYTYYIQVLRYVYGLNTLARRLREYQRAEPYFHHPICSRLTATV